MPSMAVINGHAYGGGFVLSLAHDFRIMKSTRSKVCLSEINLGFDLGHVHMGVCADSLTAKAFRELVLGIAWQGLQAKEEKVVDELYTE